MENSHLIRMGDSTYDDKGLYSYGDILKQLKSVLLKKIKNCVENNELMSILKPFRSLANLNIITICDIEMWGT